MQRDFPKTRMLSPTESERVHGSVIRTFSFFLLIWITGTLAQELISFVFTSPDDTASVKMLVQLFSTSITAVLIIVWVRCFEHRSFLTLGFSCRGAVVEYVIGAVGGILLFGCAVGICAMADVVRISASEAPPTLWQTLLFLVGFLIQGLSEELLCRSFLMVSLSRQLPRWVCAWINAAVFSLLHLFNPGITLLSLLNIFLFGIFASILTLRRGSIWMVAALHSLWNFAQGNLFGIPVSGITGMPAPLSTTPVAGYDLLSGGAFGIEGGLAATFVLIAGIFIVVLIPTKKKRACRIR